jgi:hypothetical protein
MYLDNVCPTSGGASSKERAMEKSRFIVGLVLIAVAVLIFVLGSGSGTTAGATTIGILGIILVAISRRSANRNV